MKRGQDAPLQVPDTTLQVGVRPSPNFGDRRKGRAADMLLLHYTGMTDAEGALSWLCDPGSEVSAHYLVFEDGRIVQMVAEAHRAWHAGRSYWQGERDINSCSIGIEIANAGYLGCDSADRLPEFPEPQIAAVEALCRDIVLRNNIPPARVLGHSDVAPGRKQDPGEKFDWRRLAKAGVGIWSDDTGEGPLQMGLGDRGDAVTRLQKSLQGFGYDIAITGIYEPSTQFVVRAFQQHWRQECADGSADFQTIQRLEILLDLQKRRGILLK
ncbi:MAG: N-acetylmuramoyl-L-alanine amidase [Fimbriimonadaceae bacterium]|nr:N-acetylmuramoyl-L-alanine amidase [Alphaproteobacteria bacterium]